jgi:penicillin-binding protein 1B
MVSKKPKKTKPQGKSSPKTLLKAFLCLFLILGIAVTAFLVRYYYIFDGNIELKLGKRQSMAETKIFAAPAILYPGKRISFSELELRLRKLGYDEHRTDADISHYQILQANRMLVYNDSSVLENPRQKVEIRCAENTIQSIRNLNDGTALESFSLKPEMLSNAINANREKRRLVSYDKIPQVLINAVLASEDRRFFSHSGIDPIRILKALIVDIQAGEAAQGASTLTQQFVKNYFLTPERTWRRKFADAYMSILLERRLTKSQIFELYSNEVYLGQAGSFSIIGFGEAADVFFHKNIKDLTVEEAATIAGIITAPNRYTPLRYPERATVRRNMVLDQMADFEMISPQERDQAKSKPLSVKSTTLLNYSDAPYFVDYVQDLLIGKYGNAALAHSKFKVFTTLNTELQKAAFESMQIGIAELDATLSKRKEPIAPGTVQASLIAVDPKNGHILAMIGGRNYGGSQFNHAIKTTAGEHFQAVCLRNSARNCLLQS